MECASVILAELAGTQIVMICLNYKFKISVKLRTAISSILLLCGY